MIEISKNTAYSDTMLGKKPFTTLDGKKQNPYSNSPSMATCFSVGFSPHRIMTSSMRSSPCSLILAFSVLWGEVYRISLAVKIIDVMIMASRFGYLAIYFINTNCRAAHWLKSPIYASSQSIPIATHISLTIPVLYGSRGDSGSSGPRDPHGVHIRISVAAVHKRQYSNLSRTSVGG